MKSLFCCPICEAPLEHEQQRYSCPSGHSFDIAAAGYTYLLPANQKHSKNPGDDKAMVAARSAFLERGHYAPLLSALCAAIQEYMPPVSAPVLLDSGCGEGYYTAGLYRALTESGLCPSAAGIDISKFALRRAAKRLPQGEFAVASVYRLPLADQSVDVISNIFSPLADTEFARILRPGGLFCYVVPSARHLWEMKRVLYSSPYENPVKREEYPGFSWITVRQVRYPLHLAHTEDIMALFHMTPYAWKTPRLGVERLEQLDHLDTQIGFDIHLYRKMQ